MKRALDLLLGAVLLALFGPLLLVLAVLVRLDSRGPALFDQQRMGALRRVDEHGNVVWELRPFRIFKFRSMRTDADPSVHKRYIEAFVKGRAKAEPRRGKATFKLNDDARITRMGHFLRRTSLDELPQLLNVVRGEMSLVGPRPVPLYEVAHYEDWHFERLAALPGMTGLWQVFGRGRVTFEEMMRMDIEYARRQSPGLDLKILCLTLPAVLRGSGAR